MFYISFIGPLLSAPPMEDTPFPVPSCFSAGGGLPEESTTDVVAAAKYGQSVVASVYRTKIAGHRRLITVTWCRGVLAHGRLVSVDDEAPGNGGVSDRHGSNSSSPVLSFKAEMRPWHFWRKRGSKRFEADGRPVDAVWDLRRAKFSGDPEPQSDFFVAVASEHEASIGTSTTGFSTPPVPAASATQPSSSSLCPASPPPPPSLSLPPPPPPPAPAPAHFASSSMLGNWTNQLN